MPSKNEVKHYVEEAYYHVYNRGVERRLIFIDEQDYAVFLSYLKHALLPKNERELQRALVNPRLTTKEKADILRLLRLKNFNDEIILLCYCLMKNHFHLLIKQHLSFSMASFMNSFLTRYAMYFNRKYKRVGPLFEGVYKAVLVQTDEQLIELSRYIHRNPVPLLSKRHPLQSYPYSSLTDYLGVKKTPWVRPENILLFFSTKYPTLTYQSFVKEQEEIVTIRKLVVEDF